MIRSVLAIALSMTVTVPAFAQSEGEKTWNSITKIKDTITAYDQGTGTALAYWGKEVAKYSFIGLGAVAAADTFALPTARVFGKFAYPRFIQQVTSPFRYAQVSSTIKQIGTPVAALGITAIVASGIVFAAQHLWYGVAGQPHPSALTPEQAQLAAFFQQSNEAIFAQAQQDPELASKLNELADSISLVEGIGYAK